jgi:hypothetical protein
MFFSHRDSRSRLPPQRVANQVYKTIEMELAGIKIAAIMGFKSPRTAKLKPTTL